MVLSGPLHPLSEKMSKKASFSTSLIMRGFIDSMALSLLSKIAYAQDCPSKIPPRFHDFLTFYRCKKYFFLKIYSNGMEYHLEIL